MQGTKWVRSQFGPPSNGYVATIVHTARDRALFFIVLEQLHQ